MIIREKLHGVCPLEMELIVNFGIVCGVSFVGGCDGNLKAVNALISGMPIDMVIERLEGIRCGKKDTSCAAKIAEVLKRVRGEK